MSPLPLIGSGIYLQTWCPSHACDPCVTCVWHEFGRVPGAFGLFTPDFFVSPDGTIDQRDSFCGAPYWGLGAYCASPGSAVLGDIVSGSVQISVSGLGYVTGDATPPTAPPQAWTGTVSVTWLGATAFSYDGHDAVTSTFAATAGGTQNGPGGATIYEWNWSLQLQMPAEDAIFLGSYAFSPWNCVIPFTGDFPSVLSPVDTDICPVYVTFANEFTGGVFYDYVYNGSPPYDAFTDERLNSWNGTGIQGLCYMFAR